MWGLGTKGAPGTFRVELRRQGGSCAHEASDFTVKRTNNLRRHAWQKLAAGPEAVLEGSVTLLAPMPGLVIEILVAEGQEVQEGDVLVILESMKMQNELRAPRNGTVSQIQTQLNDNVERKQALLVLN